MTAIGMFCIAAVLAVLIFSMKGCIENQDRLSHEHEQSKLRIQEETQKTIQHAIDTGETVIVLPSPMTR